jgi:uncharacterized protein (DUF1501 family)
MTSILPPLTRRHFLGLGGRSLALLAAPPLLRAAALDRGLSVPANERVLVVIQLKGGNDGLNTLIPLGDEAYYRLRPSLAVPPGKAIAVSPGAAFHPACDRLVPLYRAGRLAVIQGVGFPGANRSHYRAQEAWSSGLTGQDGWLGRYAGEPAFSGRHAWACHGTKLPPRALHNRHPAADLA